MQIITKESMQQSDNILFSVSSSDQSRQEDFEIKLCN